MVVHCNIIRSCLGTVNKYTHFIKELYAYVMCYISWNQIILETEIKKKRKEKKLTSVQPHIHNKTARKNHVTKPLSEH